MVGDKLKEWRERWNVKQGQLAKRLGVANNTVSRWELGEREIPPYLELALKTIESEILATQKGDDNK